MHPSLPLTTTIPLGVVGSRPLSLLWGLPHLNTWLWIPSSSARRHTRSLCNSPLGLGYPWLDDTQAKIWPPWPTPFTSPLDHPISSHSGRQPLTDPVGTGYKDGDTMHLNLGLSLVGKSISQDGDLQRVPQG
jgi:hypothetical protein